ncbi:hypothetical protein FRC12_003285 [Ceratobasidium sp. 428]|nr:hypothetical protein FRC12_003285 [Ceratobasidium sp. 428]
MFKRPKDPYGERLAEWEAKAQASERANTPRVVRGLPTRGATGTPAAPVRSVTQSRPSPRPDAGGSDVEMANADASQALVIYNPSMLKRTRADYESTLPNRREEADRENGPRKRQNKELPAIPPGPEVVPPRSPKQGVGSKSPRRASPGPSTRHRHFARSDPPPPPRPPNQEAGPSGNSPKRPKASGSQEKPERRRREVPKPENQEGRESQRTKRASKPAKHTDKGKRVSNSRSRASDFDDTDEDDSDTETIASLYATEPSAPRGNEFAQILAALQLIAGKLDQFITSASQPREERPVNQGSSNPTTSDRKPTTSRAARQKRNLRPWNQKEVNNEFVGPQTREEARKIVQGHIRTRFLSAFKIKSTKEGIPDGPPDNVTEPTLENFYIKWDESVHSVFNQTACDLIIGQLFAEFPTLFNDDSYDQLSKMVKSHAKYLMRAYRWQQLPSGHPVDETRHLNSSANRRMHTLFNHRMHVIDTIPQLNMHRDLFVRLGIDGTSSDEEDPDVPGQYRVKKIKQLSSSVRDLKQNVDDLFEVLEKGRKTQGSRGRKRVRTNEPSSRTFRIKGLPENCLNRVWMHRLSASQKGWYKFSDYEYKFVFPEELLKL